MMPQTKAHPTRTDYEAYKEWRDREEARQKRAVLTAYEQEDAPVVSKGVAIWALMAVIIAVAVVLGLVVRP